MKEHKEDSLDNESKKNIVINIYNSILQQFCKHISCGHIIKLERGIITQDGQEYYKDYFETTHTEMKNEFRKGKIEENHQDLVMVNKAITNKQEIIFSQDIKAEIPGKNIIFLDDILENTPKNIRHLFYKKIEELRIEERIYRERKRLKNIQETTNEAILEDI